MAETEKRAQFGSKLGFILASAGSAVGLGNIWKFPTKAYACGGGTFLLIYIALVAVLGTTVMLAEFALGRGSQKNLVAAFRKSNNRWTWIGILGILTGFLILCYYVQVGGWTMKYIIAYFIDTDAIYQDPSAYYLNMLGAEAFPLQSAVIYPQLFLLSTAFVVSRGIPKGIEQMSRILMPIFFFLLLTLMLCACMLPGASAGVKYLLTFDFSTVNASTILTALGQAFFSLSLGMGIMSTYASYLKKEENLVSATGIVCLLDTVVAVCCGFLIIPAVFATGIKPEIGSGFVFSAMAGVFMNIPGGTAFGIVFYFLLFFAAITSSISILETIIAVLTEELHWNRKNALTGVCILVFGIGMFYTLSQTHMELNGIWWSLETGVQPIAFGTALEYLTDRFLLPLAAFFLTFFVAWIWGTDAALEESTSNGTYPFRFAHIWVWLLKFAVPIAIATIMFAGLLFGISM